MRKSLAIGIASAFALAYAGSAFAIAIPDSGTQLCSDKIQNGTLLYVNAVQKQIRLSIKNNIKGKDSKCSGGFSCAGGANNTKSCINKGTGLPDNALCGVGFQCQPNTTKGVAGAINKAKGKLRKTISDACTSGQLLTLFGVNGTTTCPDPSNPDNGLDASELADCILEGAIGDIAGSIFGDPAGAILAKGAAEIVPDSPVVPFEVCAVTLGSVLSIGSEAGPQSPAEAGGAAPLLTENCAAGVCDTKGQGIVGNNLTAPTQTFAGVIAVCLVTVTSDSGNGTGADGTIDLNTGDAATFSPILSTVLIGTTCPICDLGVCDSGDNQDDPCSSPGGTDTACPPTIAGVPPIIPNPLDLTTGVNSLSVPANNPGGGVTNPSATFCGACDLDDTIGCQSDQACDLEGVCGAGVGLGCCVFGTNTGAFGVDNATEVERNGTPGQYLSQMGTVFCTGVSGDGLVDGTQGLPGPVSLVQAQLNTFQY